MIAEILASLSNQRLKFKFICENEVKSTYKPLTTKIYKNNLKSNYTFESMVVGEANRLSYITAMKVAEQPGTFVNPLYIFGGVGLGKTHLMQAIGNYISDNNLEANILYVQATDYRSDFIKALQTQNFLEFTQKYENLDVLLIDDIQMLSDSSKSQEEFFKLFNDLSARGKQIVITSDRKAEDLENINRTVSLCSLLRNEHLLTNKNHYYLFLISIQKIKNLIMEKLKWQSLFLKLIRTD